ncbi:SDR family NAD(P)-dependent oxidoreductase [Arthrobacter zhangbolii]|uniref:SDR family NAD(P)-dependent oxidoreductase n=1 Tax=Arthrobacter zhangbolii TaxID=2886936 RepID=A0A9X1S8T9_9MICC|nr:SDR family NAD(P)-dependent oxidoreductase [Arthrobacter zhangbolii]MCC3272353.1 SDR family NAD(P)-dependent oxidoreductase [Arthrobacter zhangbolii]UON91784.1 SDR family NAD(P)-dependent oxidoreductase [Arthrobacter zhangbolii]
MTQTAVITGATSGIGAEFARRLAERGYNLVLTGRDTGRLADAAARLAEQYSVKTEYIGADLSTEDGVAAVARRVQEPDVRILVNNAGYGLKNDFARNDLDAEVDHLNVLVTAPLKLSHAALNAMQAGGGGRIINVASLAGLLPRGTYSAAKAWLINFSRWANIYYKDRGITVTAVCPGFVHTEFHQRMQMDKSVYPKWMWLQVEQVVREGLADAFAGKGMSIPSRRYRVVAAVSKLAPQTLVAKLAGRGR